MSVHICESCGMPMSTAADHAAGNPDSPWCGLCATPEGGLQPFEERFERMAKWAMRQDGRDRPTAEQKTREYMRSMPAWKDHPALREG